MSHFRGLIFASLPLLGACGSSVDPLAVLQTVRMSEQAQTESLQANDLPGAVRLYDANATMAVPGSAPVHGSDAIRAQVQNLMADPNFKLDYKQGRGWASAGGDLAVTTGSGTITRTDAQSGKPVSAPFDYQMVWRKGDKLDGPPWTIVSDYNVAKPASELAVAQ